MTWHDDRDAEPEIDEQLRAALGGAAHAPFDHDALVAGAKQRAARLRRRRAVTTAVAAAVVLPALAGAGWIVGNRLLQPGDGSVDVAAVTQTAEPTPAPVPEDPSATTTAPEETSPASDTPPWQATPPPEPVEVDPPNPDVPHLIDIPDPRPVDIALLDRLGAPQSDSLYPRTMPLQDFMVGGSGSGGVEPHSGRSWFYFVPGKSFEEDVVSINVTAWDDSVAALRAIRDGGGLSSVWVDDDLMPTVPDPLPWAGHDDADHLLVGWEATYEGSAGSDHDKAGALVRQGDYLVGVTVIGHPGEGHPHTLEEAVEVAAEIALKTADNLAWLDPERATD